MKRSLNLWMILFILLSVSCNQKKPAAKETTPAATGINNQLTEKEKSGGLMTPEILWKFGRLGSIALSPDGSTVLYTVTKIDLQSEARETNIFRMPVEGGEAIQLTRDGGSSPQWFDAGKKIAFAKGDNLFTMNPDGSDQKKVEGIEGFEIFSIAPQGNMIYYTKRVKLDQTANEKYNLPKAKVRIIDGLMYRHWNYWSDYSYSHIFVAPFDGATVTGPKDIMEGQKFESPLSPYFDEAEITWSPDGKYVAYTTKRLRGKEDARSTNSDIYLYEVATGKEVNISVGNMGYDRLPVFSPDGAKIAYQSMQRDGYEADLDRLFVYDIKTGTRDWITKGWEFDVENIRWADNQNIYFICAHMGTSQVFKTELVQACLDDRILHHIIPYQPGPEVLDHDH